MNFSLEEKEDDTGFEEDLRNDIEAEKKEEDLTEEID
jgi:hypothetical protein